MQVHRLSADLRCAQVVGTGARRRSQSPPEKAGARVGWVPLLNSQSSVSQGLAVLPNMLRPGLRIRRLFVAGNTDLGIATNLRGERYPHLIQPRKHCRSACLPRHTGGRAEIGARSRARPRSPNAGPRPRRISSMSGCRCLLRSAEQSNPGRTQSRDCIAHRRDSPLLLRP